MITVLLIVGGIWTALALALSAGLTLAAKKPMPALEKRMSAIGQHDDSLTHQLVA